MEEKEIDNLNAVMTTPKLHVNTFTLHITQ